jgi:hypothetical protein
VDCCTGPECCLGGGGSPDKAHEDADAAAKVQRQQAQGLATVIRLLRGGGVIRLAALAAWGGMTLVGIRRRNALIYEGGLDCQQYPFYLFTTDVYGQVMGGQPLVNREVPDI